MADIEGLLQDALEKGEGGDYQAMAEVLRDGLEEHPDDPFILCWLGVAERETGMDGIAYERFKKAMAQQPEDPHLLATAGNALAAFDDPEAETALRAAALLAPELALARWMYGAYLAREGHLDDAFRELDAAVELAPEDPVIHLERGVAWALREEKSSAASAFARAVELAPEDGWARILFGIALVEDDRLEEAAAELDAGARLRPDDMEAQLLAALALAASGWDGRGLEMLERARIHAGEFDQRLFAEAESRIEEGPESAERLLRRAVLPAAYRERLMQRP